MNRSLIVDASVVIKLFVIEEFSDRAEALITDALENDQTVVAPWLMQTEVANAIHKQWREDRITPLEVDEALEQFFQIPIVYLSSAELHRRAVSFARNYRQRAIYDSLYVVLGEMLGLDFWTDDRRLLDAVRNDNSWVRWIGDYKPSS